LIAILIFSLGILGMVAMGSVAIAAQSDSPSTGRKRPTMPNEIVAEMAIQLQQGVLQPGLNAFDPTRRCQAFAHQPTVRAGTARSPERLPRIPPSSTG
jgi:hypothetical protein